MNWRGKPLTSYEVVVNLIAATTSAKGLKVKCLLDENEYPKRIKITKKEVEEWKFMVSYMENGTILSYLERRVLHMFFVTIAKF